MREKFWGMGIIFLIASFLIAGELIAVFTDDSNDAGEFGGGTFEDTQWDAGNGWVELDATGLTNGTATFTSRIIDASSSIPWNTFSWVTEQPTFKPLPNNEGVESDYGADNVDMTDNVWLFHLDESSVDGTAGEVTEDSGGGNDAQTVSMSDANIMTGQFGNAYSFDGSADYIELPLVGTGIQGSNEVSVAAWVKWESGGTGTSHIYNESYNNTGVRFSLNITADGQLKMSYRNNDAGGVIYVESGLDDLVPEDEWHHVAGTWNADNDEQKLYIDGSLVATEANGANNFPGNDAAKIRLGKAGTTANNFKGLMDEVAVFTKELTADQVSDMYQRGAIAAKFQVRSCDDALCAGESFEGPSNSTTAYYTEFATSTTSTPSFSLDVGNNRYFQYQAIFTTASSTLSPYLQSVSVVEGNSTPSTTLNLVSNVQDGAGTVSFSMNIDDADDDTLKVKVRYKEGADCSSLVGANTTTLTGFPLGLNSFALTQDNNEANGYQIGNIVTNLGEEFLSFSWDSSADVPAADGTYCAFVTPNDGTADGSTVSSTVVLDNVAPTQPGNLTMSSTGTVNATLAFPVVKSNDTNFSEYRLFFRAGSDTVVQTDDSIDQFTDINLADSNFNGAASIVLSSIDFGQTTIATNSQYSANLFVYDQYGNTNSSSAQLTFYTLADAPGQPSLGSPAAQTLDVTIDVATNNSTTAYAIFNSTTGQYVQANGSLGAVAVYQTTTTWDTPTVTGLATNTAYIFNTIARNGDNVKTATSSDSASVYTAAAVPSISTAVADSSSQITVSWGANNNPNGTEYYVVDANDPTRNSGWIEDLSYAFTNLTAGTAYTFNVKARNSDNVETAVSANISATTAAGASSSSNGGIVASSPFGGLSSGDSFAPVDATMRESKEEPGDHEAVFRFEPFEHIRAVAISEDPSFEGVPYERYGRELMYEPSDDYDGGVVYVRFLSETGATATVTVTIDNWNRDKATCALQVGGAFKSTDSSAVYYITDKCTKRPFTQPRIFFSYFVSWNDVAEVDQDRLDAIPLDPLGFMPWGERYEPLSGTLVKTVTDPKVYLLMGAQRYWISNEDTFRLLGYAWDWIEDVTDEFLEKYETAEELTEGTLFPEGALFRSLDDPRVYQVERNTETNILESRYIRSEAALDLLEYRKDRIPRTTLEFNYPEGDDIF